MLANRFKEISGAYDETRTPLLYRVKKKVTNLKPFACLAFPNFLVSNTRKKPLG